MACDNNRYDIMMMAYVNESSDLDYTKLGDKEMVYDREQEKVYIRDGNILIPLSGNEPFDTISDLQATKQLFNVGDVVEVLGYYEKGDGGDHKRIISAEQSDFSVTLTNGLEASISKDGYIDVKNLGLRGDGSDQSSEMIDISLKSIGKYNLYFPAGEYITTLLRTGDQSIKGDGVGRTIFTCIDPRPSGSSVVQGQFLDDTILEGVEINGPGLDIDNGRCNVKSNSVVRNCKFTNFISPTTGNGWNIYIKDDVNILFDNVESTGSTTGDFTFVDKLSNITLINCSGGSVLIEPNEGVEDNFGFGIRIITSTFDSVTNIRGGNISDISRGVTIDGCTIDNLEVSGIMNVNNSIIKEIGSLNSGEGACILQSNCINLSTVFENKNPFFIDDSNLSLYSSTQGGADGMVSCNRGLVLDRKAEGEAVTLTIDVDSVIEENTNYCVLAKGNNFSLLMRFIDASDNIIDEVSNNYRRYTDISTPFTIFFKTPPGTVKIAFYTRSYISNTDPSKVPTIDFISLHKVVDTGLIYDDLKANLLTVNRCIERTINTNLLIDETKSLDFDMRYKNVTVTKNKTKLHLTFSVQQIVDIGVFSTSPGFLDPMICPYTTYTTNSLVAVNDEQLASGVTVNTDGSISVLMYHGSGQPTFQLELEYYNTAIIV